MSWFIDSGTGLVTNMLHCIEQQKQIYNCKANNLSVVWYSYMNRQNHLHDYKCLLPNRLHGKAVNYACLANSWNNSVTTLSHGASKVLLWRHNQKLFNLQLINTWLTPSLVNFVPF